MLMFEGIKVGDKVNTGSWSDRYPGTVVEVKRNGKEIIIQSDDYAYDQSKGEEGKVHGHQNWVVSRNENGSTMTYSWRKSKGHDIGYLPKGASVSSASPYAQVQMGWRYYYDWSF
jgi:hypothetical protein